MAAKSLPPQRRLLLMAMVLATSAALAGGLTVSVLTRGRAPAMPPSALAAAATPACAPAALGLPEPDPMAALDAALGNPVAPPGAARERQEGGMTDVLAGLLAVPPRAEAMPTVAGSLVTLVPGPAAPPALALAPQAPAAASPVAAPPATPPPPAAPTIVAGYTLDLGYFLVPDQAVAFATRVQERGVPVQLLSLPDPSGRVWTHVRTPPFAGSAQALAGAERIERALGVAASLVPPGTPTIPTPAGASRP